MEMWTVRRSEERGGAYHGWLDTKHTFSFAGYYDPEHMGFRSLRVINEDRVTPGQGFPTHGHRDMEIISYVLEGRLEHEDTMGNRSVIEPGDVQRMSAGTGVMHSEYNASDAEGVHFLQIWIVPSRKGLLPSYEQKRFGEEATRNRWALAASPDGADGSVRVHQDARLYLARLDPGASLEHERASGRHLWLHVARGRVQLGELELGAGDAASTRDGQLAITGREDSEVLHFDLA